MLGGYLQSLCQFENFEIENFRVGTSKSKTEKLLCSPDQGLSIGTKFVFFRCIQTSGTGQNHTGTDLHRPKKIFFLHTSLGHLSKVQQFSAQKNDFEFFEIRLYFIFSLKKSESQFYFSFLFSSLIIFCYFIDGYFYHCL